MDEPVLTTCRTSPKISAATSLATSPPSEVAIIIVFFIATKISMPASYIHAITFIDIWASKMSGPTPHQ
ncbi:hypothetical protein BRADI_2g12943v3 [Brachypodium distachyon]|uniref:Uncharacterized protein n=1 Tax=Brachypodium distachyon TaxID=15368 RepID=A0A2K2D898_BRADI|nr:hypothetical protein BRADI_2g12943v3 [Brachypodium distachyon]